MRRAAVVLLLLVALATCGPKGRTTAPAERLRADDTLTGVVLDASGAPEAGVAIWVDDERRATTDPQGAFAVAGLAPGPHLIEAIGADAALAPVNLHMRGTRSVTLQLQRAWTIEVTVTDDDGRPVAGAIVDPTRRAVRTGVDGVAIVRNAHAEMKIRADGFGRGKTGWPDEADDGIRRVGVSLRRGSPVSGTVTADDPTVLQGLRVWVRMDRGGIDDVADLDAQGRWTIAALPIGKARLSVHRGGFRLAEQRIEITRSETAFPLALPSLATLRGVVVDQAGQAVTGARVYAKPQVYTTTDASGAFVLAGLPRRSIPVSASHGSLASAVVDVDLSTGVASRTFTIERSELRGRILDPQGRPVAGARVTARPKAYRSLTFPEAADVTDDDGAFVIGPVAPGAYRVKLLARGARGELVRGRDLRTDQDLVLRLAPDSTIRARLTLDGKPVTTFAVTIAKHARGLGYGTTEWFHSEAGELQMSGVPAGRTVVGFHGQGFAEYVTTTLQLRPGHTLDLGTIALTPGRSIRGRVVDADGAPVADAWVVSGVDANGSELVRRPRETRRPEFAQRLAATDASGAFTIDHVGAVVAIGAGHAALGRSEVLTTSESEVTLTLIRTGTVRGVVRGVTSGRPMLVRIRGEHELESALVEPDGSFASDPLMPGKYRARVEDSSDERGPVVHLEVTGGQVTTIELEAPPP